MLIRREADRFRAQAGEVRGIAALHIGLPLLPKERFVAAQQRGHIRCETGEGLRAAMMDKAAQGAYQSVARAAQAVAQIVVLEGAQPEAFVEAADLVQGAAADRQTEAHEHVGVGIRNLAQREVGGKQVKRLQACHGGRDLLAVARPVGAGPGGGDGSRAQDTFYKPRQSHGGHDRIAVEKQEDSAGRRFPSLVAGSGKAPVSGVAEDLDAITVQRFLQSVIRGRVVDDDHFPHVGAAGGQTVEAAPQVLASAVQRNNDRHGGRDR